MTRAGLVSFLAQAQGVMSDVFPAVITIAEQNYACASSGIVRDRDLIGGWLDKWKVTFIVKTALFVTANKTVAKARDYVTIVSIGEAEPVIAVVVIKEASLDATGTLVTLRCENPEQ